MDKESLLNRNNKDLTKEEKKEKKRIKKEERTKARQRRKNKKRKVKDTKENFYTLGGRFGDRDPRTKGGIRTLYIRKLTNILLISGLILLIVQVARMVDYQTNNSTPVGTDITFEKSGATVKIADIWTDKQREVTVVKLKYSNKAREVLSLSGDKYNLYFLHTTRHKPDIEMKYGLLGSEGDGYLFIKGKLDKRAYEIVMANALDVLYKDNKDKRSIDIKKLQDKAIEETISNASYTEAKQESIFNKMFQSNKKAPKNDIINFRINAFSENTKVYDGSFLTEDGDIDYGKVVSKTSLSHAVKKLEETLKNEKLERQSYTVSLEEYKDRLKRDKDNKDAADSVKRITKNIEEKDELIEALEKEIEVYKNASFSKDNFGNMQEKFKYFDKQKAGY